MKTFQFDKINNDKQLTPEVISKELEIFFTKRKPLDMKNPAYPAMLIEEYAADKTAAKDEEIAALRELFTNSVSLLQAFPIAEPGDFNIGGKHHDWYCKRTDLLASFGMIGTGILAWRQTMAERIKELEERYIQFRDGIDKQDARIAELEKDKAEFDSKTLELMVRHEQERYQLLEKVERLEKDFELVKASNFQHVIELGKIESERDQAFDLLEKLHVNGQVNDIMYRIKLFLSSRENKKPEQVDIVCPLCNGKGFTWALNRLGDDDAKECPRCQGIGKTTENKKPNE